MGKRSTVEIWEDIKGFEGHYQVSTLGRVRSLDRVVKSGQFVRGKILKAATDKAGYVFIYLRKDCKSIFFRIHRLVALTFIKNPANKLEVNHINGIKKDNKVDNLEWCTTSENRLHSFRKLNRKPSRAWLGKFGKDNPRSMKIIQETKQGEMVATFNSMTEASAKTGFTMATISKIINKKVTPRYFNFKKA